MKYISRTVEDNLRKTLNKGQAIVIYGPRQAGKTTLAMRLLDEYSSDRTAIFQADDPSQASLFTPNTDSLGRLVQDKDVIFIDEAQMIENAGLVIKLLVDTFPEVQIIATGSSSFTLSDTVKESAVGRVIPITLLPLSAEELAPDYLSKIRFDLDRSLRLGGYPRVILSDDERAKRNIATIVDGALYKDILTLAETRNPELIQKLLSVLALQVGQEVSYDELANLLDVNRATIERYVWLLEQAFVIFRLQPLSSNPRKVFASRKRKIYFYDLGVRNTLAGQINLPALNSSQLGGIFENFIILERMKYLYNRQIMRLSNYWRSPDSEIDYLETYDGITHAHEIKWKKEKKTPPPLFAQQFSEHTYSSITSLNYWDFIAEIKKSN